MSIVLDRETVKRFFRHVVNYPIIVIVGFMPDDRMMVAYCTSVDSAVDCCIKLDRLGAVGIFTCLHQLKAEFAPPSKDTLHYTSTIPKNSDMQELVRWMLVDMDAKTLERVKGTCATDSEKARVLEVQKQVLAFLQEQGFEEPYRTDSGNGYGLIYAVEPMDNQTLKTIIRGLNAKFSIVGAVDVDRSVTALKQLTRVPGTINRKGDNTAERPHRITFLVGGDE